MKTIWLTIVAALSAASLFAQAPVDSREIMVKSREQARLASLEAKTTLEINDGKGNQRIRETRMVSKIFPDGSEKRTILFLSPADVRGTGILIWDYEGKEDNMWIFLPALRKSRKIVSSEKSKNFMGSEFSNADLAADNIGDFTYQSEGTETLGDQLCWKIRVSPANDKVAGEYGLSSKITWISQKDLMPRKTVFYDTKGEAWKEVSFSGISLLDAKANKYFITGMEVKNLRNGRFSKMTMTGIKYNPSVGEEVFTLAYIEKQ
jgi:outer membrane lipoprotein-sorting protein